MKSPDLKKQLENNSKICANITATYIIITAASAIAFGVAYGIFMSPMVNPDTKYMLEFKRLDKEQMGTAYDELSGTE